MLVHLTSPGEALLDVPARVSACRLVAGSPTDAACLLDPSSSGAYRRPEVKLT